MAQAQRVEFIDLLKGMTIFFVIIFHLTYFHSGTYEVRRFITPFFMQLFFFLSGMFFSTKGSFKDFMLNKLNRIIIPLLFFYFLNYFLGFIASNILGLGKGRVDVLTWHSLLDLFNGKEFFTFGSAMWFLICLLIINILYYFIAKAGAAWLSLAISFALTLTGFVLYVYTIDLPYFIDSAFSMILFFSLGTILKKRDFFVQKNKFDALYLIIGLCLYLALILTRNVEAIVMKNTFTGNFADIIAGGILGSFAMYMVSKVIYKVKFINFYGVNSLIVLCTHQLVIVLYAMILKKFFAYNGFIMLGMNLVLTLITEYFIILFFNYFTPAFVGKKDLIKRKPKNQVVADIK